MNERSSSIPSTQSTKCEYAAEYEPGLETVCEAPNIRMDSTKNREKLLLTYVNEAVKYDTAMLSEWNDALDVLIIMAGLFATVLTAFITGSFQLLQTNPQDTTNALLSAILSQLEGQATPTKAEIQNMSNSFNPSLSTIMINIFLFSSLVCTLSAAFIAMLAKQWLQAYTSNRPGRVEIHARQRQFRYEGLRSWKVPEIISILPFLMQLAFMLFFLGLNIWLLTVNVLIGSLITTTTVILLAFYIITTISPFFNLACPFKNPFTFILRTRLRWIWCSLTMLFQYFSALVESLYLKETHPPFPWFKPMIPDADIETKHFEELQHSLDIGIIEWLARNCHNETVLDTAFKSIAELRPNINVAKRYRDSGVLERLLRRLKEKSPISSFMRKKGEKNTIGVDTVTRSHTTAYIPDLASLYCCLRFCTVNDINPIRSQLGWRSWIIIWRNLPIERLLEAGWDPDALALYLASSAQCDRADGRVVNRCFLDMVDLLDWHSRDKGTLSDFSQWALVDSIAQWGAQFSSASMMASQRSVISSLIRLLNSTDFHKGSISITSTIGVALGVFVLGFGNEKMVYYQDEEKRRRDGQTLLIHALTNTLKDNSVKYSLAGEDLEAAGLAICTLFLDHNTHDPLSSRITDALITILLSTSSEDVACRILETFQHLLTFDSQSTFPNLPAAISPFFLSSTISDVTKTKATQVIAEMGQWSCHRTVIVEHGLVNSLIDNLTSPCRELADASSTALLDFARDSEIRQIMVSHGLVNALTTFFKSDMSSQANLAYWSLSFSCLDWTAGTTKWTEESLKQFSDMLRGLGYALESFIEQEESPLSPAHRQELRRILTHLKMGRVENLCQGMMGNIYLSKWESHDNGKGLDVKQL
ncbi:hypothetical protein Clacol_006040 [Clathrus columnatus]|uniref:DUF6535 domain-containing protein n=1 Tax=Clathrus columnatus TaxID=1419009 RepID=A0AAV5ADU8_9AGAM|nr:hypothetical protein Clacol_006040 [Clathrus columnatus]